MSEKNKGIGVNNKYTHLLYFIIFLPITITAAIVIEGDTSGAASFTFAVGSHTRSALGESFYTGALTAGTANEFALSRNAQNQSIFEPFSPLTATINGVPDQSNPLYNAAITQLSTFDTKINRTTVALPMAVTQASPANLFLVHNKKGNIISMLGLPNVKDVNSTTTTGIIGLQSFLSEAIFAAVTPSSSGTFGDSGSGVAVIKLANIESNNISQPVLVQINADPTTVLPATDAAASPLDTTSASLKINNNLATINNSIDMHFSTRLNRLYIALQVVGGANPTDGARAIAVGQLKDNKLSFFAIAPDAVFTDSNEIVGGVGANSQISIEKVRTMYTSTKLDYLIVVGNNGASGTTGSSVFALPLVNTIPTGTINESIQGTLANVLDAPVDIYSNQANNPCENVPQLLTARVFTTAATLSGQIFLNSSIEAIVGGTNLPYGNITDINVYNDAIFVSVATPTGNELPGIFYSQALFNSNGTISSWTPWQRVSGTTDEVYGISYQPVLGNFLWLTGASSVTVDTAKQTTWGMGSTQGIADLVTITSQLFPSTSGGVQGFFNLPPNSPGLFNISLYIATGLARVMLVESGEVIAGVLTPNTGDFQTNAQQFTNGTISTNFPVANCKVVTISGGVLSTIGAIIASTIGVNNNSNQGYLFVGGACGCAVLIQPDGSGWSTTTGLGINFDGLVNDMQFVSLGNYSFVRKLIYDDTFLYVLTDTQLDRIDITLSNFATQTLSVTTVATLTDIDEPDNGTLLDVVISGKMAVLASSNGLYRVGNNADIRTAASHIDVDWTTVAIPEGVSVVQYLQTIAQSSTQNSWATSNGNLYINDAYRGFDTAQINRYTVADVSASPITSSTITPLPDIYIKNIVTSFRTFNNFRNITLYDGAALFSTLDRVHAVPPVMYNWSTAIPLNIDNYNTISSIVRSSASGAWVVSGDFGLRVNE